MAARKLPFVKIENYRGSAAVQRQMFALVHWQYILAVEKPWFASAPEGQAGRLQATESYASRTA